MFDRKDDPGRLIRLVSVGASESMLHRETSGLSSRLVRALANASTLRIRQLHAS